MTLPTNKAKCWELLFYNTIAETMNFDLIKDIVIWPTSPFEIKGILSGKEPVVMFGSRGSGRSHLIYSLFEEQIEKISMDILPKVIADPQNNDQIIFIEGFPLLINSMRTLSHLIDSFVMYVPSGPLRCSIIESVFLIELLHSFFFTFKTIIENLNVDNYNHILKSLSIDSSEYAFIPNNVTTLFELKQWIYQVKQKLFTLQAQIEDKSLIAKFFSENHFRPYNEIPKLLNDLLQSYKIKPQYYLLLIDEFEHVSESVKNVLSRLLFDRKAIVNNIIPKLVVREGYKFYSSTTSEKQNLNGLAIETTHDYKRIQINPLIWEFGSAGKQTYRNYLENIILKRLQYCGYDIKDLTELLGNSKDIKQKLVIYLDPKKGKTYNFHGKNDLLDLSSGIVRQLLDLWTSLVNVKTLNKYGENTFTPISNEQQYNVFRQYSEVLKQSIQAIPSYGTRIWNLISGISNIIIENSLSSNIEHVMTMKFIIKDFESLSFESKEVINQAVFNNALLQDYGRKNQSQTKHTFIINYGLAIVLNLIPRESYPLKLNAKIIEQLIHNSSFKKYRRKKSVKSGSTASQLTLEFFSNMK